MPVLTSQLQELGWNTWQHSAAERAELNTHILVWYTWLPTVPWPTQITSALEVSFWNRAQYMGDKHHSIFHHCDYF